MHDRICSARTFWMEFPFWSVASWKWMPPLPCSGLMRVVQARTASSFFAAGTPVTSSAFSIVYSLVSSWKASHTVRALCTEPSLSVTSTSPGSSAGRFGKPLGLHASEPSGKRSGSVAGSANVDWSGSHASATSGLYGCSIHVPVVGMRCSSPSHLPSSASQYVRRSFASSHTMKRWYLPSSLRSASVSSFVFMLMPPLPSTNQPSVSSGLSST